MTAAGRWVFACLHVILPSGPAWRRPLHAP